MAEPTGLHRVSALVELAGRTPAAFAPVTIPVGTRLVVLMTRPGGVAKVGWIGDGGVPIAFAEAAPEQIAPCS